MATAPDPPGESGSSNGRRAATPAAPRDARADRGTPSDHGGRFGDLRTRLVSGVALFLVCGGLLWLGGAASALLVSIAAGAMALEYRAVTTATSGGFARRDSWFPAIVAIAPLLSHVSGDVSMSVSLILGGVVAAAGLDRGGGRDWRWSAPGLILLGVASSAFVFLRDQPQYGLAVCVWLVLVVVASDVGGYFAGRLVGGPRLAPRISPTKTWAGLVGGAGLAATVGGLFSWATTGTYAEEVVTVSLLASAVAQGGDLAESALKRRFGVKDSGRLIPGHGGALDRLDGLMAATLVAAAVTFARGKEVFIW